VGGYLVIDLRHQYADLGESEPWFSLLQESDGTLRILGILAALYQDPPRKLIAIEEPELTIHPGAMSVLWEEIESAAERSQIILTTHSPDLLDMCRAEQLRVVEKVRGITEIGPIAEEQKKIIQQRLFAPGQLLRAHGLHRVWEE
jgi:predicted ATPase